jgi:hypothetical protein
MQQWGVIRKEAAMRLANALLAILLLTSAGTAIDRGKTKNGYWWSELSETSKLWFVKGYIEGLTRADKLLSQSLDFRNAKPPSAVTRIPVESYLDFTEISYGQFMDGLDIFYNDYRNKRININIALLYVRDQIRGVSETDLNKRLEGMRKAATEPDYDER